MRRALVLAGGLALFAACWLLRSEAPREPAPVRVEEPVREELEGAAPTLAPVEPVADGRVALSRPPEALPTPPAPKRDLPGRISGIVLEPDGSPRRLAIVRFGWNDRGRMREAHVSTGVDGRFELAFEDPRARGELLATVHKHVLAPVALPEVEAGTRGVELRLGPPAFFTIEVLDPEGRAVACSEPQLSWSLGGARISDRALPGNPWSWARSPVPFFVSVSARGHAGGWLGPFEPARVGDVLQIVLEPYACIRGKVTHAGQPVAGATVSMRKLPAPGDDEYSSLRYGALSPRTEADGRFEVPCREAGAYEASTFVLPHGAGRVGPVLFDGVNDLDGITIDLDRAPGAIAGRVLFPSGHGPEEIWLEASGGHGYRPLRRDGSFLLPDLPPGPCRIEVIEGYGWDELPGEPGESWVSMTHGPSGGPSWLRYGRAYRIEVPPGGRAHLEIDLTGPLACEISGRVRIDGAAPKLRPGDAAYDFGGSPNVRLPSREPHRVDAATHLDDDGRFVLGVSEPGSRRLELELELHGAKEEQWTVRDLVELRDGRTEWSLDVATGSLLILPPDEEHPLWSRYPGALWQGPGELSIRVEYAEIDEVRGSRLYRRVPVGRVRLESDSGEGAVVLECEIVAGKTTELRWPQ